MRPLRSLLPFLALVALAASFGALFRPGAWYGHLHKPPGTPPDAVFGPVWTLLYLAIAVAAWRVWRARPGASAALGLWGGQLVLNAAWSYLFFGLQRPGVALVELAVLLALVALTTRAFHAIDRTAGLLFLPYLGWVAYAGYLNAGIWWLNR